MLDIILEDGKNWVSDSSRLSLLSSTSGLYFNKNDIKMLYECLTLVGKLGNR